MGPRLRSTCRALAVVAALGLAGCGTGPIDRQQAAEEARTCASLIERVIARARARTGLFGPEPKDGPISPEVLAEDPDTFYAALAERIAALSFGPQPDAVPVSASARFVGQCRTITE